jgi:hypothetical protein
MPRVERDLAEMLVGAALPGCDGLLAYPMTR